MNRPLYNQLVPYYELLESRDWEGEVNLIKSVLEEHSCKSVIDLGCGTGRHVRELAKLGFEVTGIDISNQNIKFARKKASEAGIDARFVRGNYFDYQPAKGYDAATCLNWSIPVKDDQIRRLLDKTFSILRSSGILILDYERVSDIVWSDVGKPIVDSWIREGEVIVRVSVGKVDSNVLSSDDVYLIYPRFPARIPPDEKSRYEVTNQLRRVKVYTDTSYVRFFSPLELRHFAQESSLATIRNLVLSRNGYKRNYLVLVKKA